MKTVLLLSLIAAGASAQTPPAKDGASDIPDAPVIYEYRKYEKVDLSGIDVTGETIGPPGDLSVRDRERKRFETPLFNRKETGDLRSADREALR
jgi:hypothetical protein